MFSFDILQLLVLRPGRWRTGFRASGIAGAASWCRCCSCSTARGAAATTCWRFARGTTGRPGKKRREICHITLSVPRIHSRCKVYVFPLLSRLPSLLSRHSGRHRIVRDSVEGIPKRNLTTFIRFVSLQRLIIIATREASKF